MSQNSKVQCINIKDASENAKISVIFLKHFYGRILLWRILNLLKYFYETIWLKKVLWVFKTKMHVFIMQSLKLSF